MSENGLMTQSAFAAEIGVGRATISDLVMKLGITPKSMTNGLAKGLDAADRRKIRKALNIKVSSQPATA